ncbi:MAG TPA: hypothetical protein VGM54_17060 [Chthoniobacter sp.]|jgi:hypothetical protein
MRKILTVFGLLAFAVGHVSVLANGEISGDAVMVNPSEGWWCKVAEKNAAILHTDDGGRHWKDVSPSGIPTIVKQLSTHPSEPVLDDVPGLDAVDGRRAWVSILPVEAAGIWLYGTRDAGRHWTRAVASFAAEIVFLNFFDMRRGYLLAGGHGLGHMDQDIYHTDDGGRHWRKRATTKDRGYYTSGMVFRTPSEGWLTGSYRSVEFPLFHTANGARSWQLQKFPVPKDYVGGYANTYPPVFTGARKMNGYLPVELVRHDPKPDHRAWVNYESEDGGRTWHLPAAGVQSVNED